MSLQFVFGPSGSGKTYTLYDSVIKEACGHPERNYIVLVPEQFTMQTQKDLVSRHPDHGIMNIDVLSFGRLAYRIFEETGGASLPVLDDEGKSLILRKIAEDHGDELKVLRGNLRKPGYISEVKSVLSEFVQYDIKEQELERVMETLEQDSTLYYKLHDLSVLYRGFTGYLEEKFITKEEILDVLSREIPKSEILKNAVIALDGFTGFTPVQERVLRELLLCCDKVIVTVTIDERENPYVCKHPYQLFALSKRMVTNLIQIAKEERILLEAPVERYGRPPYRFREKAELAFLERNLFRYGKETYEGQTEAVSLHLAEHPRGEAYAVAGRVRELVRTKGWRYREIGVIASSMDAYGDALKDAFEAYDIPVFMDHKRSILQNSFVEYIRSLLYMAEQSFSYESVFRFLKTDLAGISYDDVCLMENYVLGLGIKGYKKWQEKWIRRLPGTTEEELIHLNHCRVQFVEKVDPFLFVLRQRKKTVRDITVALYEFMVQEDLQSKIRKQEEAFQAAGELALAKECAQIYRILIELFDKFVELLGEEEVSLNEYCKLLDAGLSEARVGVIPPGIDQVVAGDITRTRLKELKALLFVGANDVYLPGALMRSGLLSERDRDCFGKEKIALAPGGKEQAYIQKFYLYQNLTKPSMQLEIYYSKVSMDGKSMRPSYLVQEICRLYPDINVQDESAGIFGRREMTEEMGIDALIRGFQRKEETTDAWQELYSWYFGKEEWRARIETFLDAGYYRRSHDRLSEAVAKKLYGEHFENSITRVERFCTCAYAHFLTYGLRLKERREYEFQPMDLGNICHKALELFSEKIKKERLDWTEITEEEYTQYIGECVEEAVADYGNSVLYSSSRNEYRIIQIKQMLTRSVWAIKKQLAVGDFVPEDYELRFENGKIDRVDICEDDDKVYVKIVDYKTGSKTFDVIALYHGLQLQLMIYMDAALKEQERRHPGKEIIPAGVFYYRIQDPFVDKKEKVDEVEREILKILKPDGIINLKNEVLKHLDRMERGESFAIPVKYNKNGSLSQYSKVASEWQFRAMMNHAVRKTEEICGRILDGEMDPAPYRRGQESGCDYCQYRHVCGFDVKIPGYEYRDLERMNKKEVLAAMEREEMKEEEQNYGGSMDQRPAESDRSEES